MSHVTLMSSRVSFKLVGSIKLQVSSAKEPYKKDYILQKRPTILLMSSWVYSWAHEYDELVGSIKLYVSFAKEPYKRDYILQKRPSILSILRTVVTPYCTEQEHHVTEWEYPWMSHGTLINETLQTKQEYYTTAQNTQSSLRTKHPIFSTT